MYKKKIAIYHPMQQHSYQTAVALCETNRLFAYITTVYYDEKKIIYRVLKRILGKNNTKRMLNKQNKELEPYLVTNCTILGLLYLFLARVDKKNLLKSRFQNIISRISGIVTGRYLIKNNVDIVICYDTWSYGLIRYLKNKKSTIKIVLDMSSIPAKEIRKILDINSKKTPLYANKAAAINKMFDDKYIKMYNFEIEYADFYFVPSAFSKQKLIDFGVQENKIYINEYGSNFDSSSYEKKHINKPITFLYLGQVSVAKGFHYLLDAVEQLNKENKVYKLLVVGSSGEFNAELSDTLNIEYKGVIPHTELVQIFKQSDIFITPSLYDSFSFSLTESMSMYLPVISTFSVGASQFIKNGESGFIIDPMNSKALYLKMKWFLENTDRIIEMGSNAKKTSNEITWEKYYKKINDSINCIIEETRR